MSGNYKVSSATNAATAIEQLPLLLLLTKIRQRVNQLAQEQIDNGTIDQATAEQVVSKTLSCCRALLAEQQQTTSTVESVFMTVLAIQAKKSDRKNKPPVKVKKPAPATIKDRATGKTLGTISSSAQEVRIGANHGPGDRGIGIEVQWTEKKQSGGTKKVEKWLYSYAFFPNPHDTSYNKHQNEFYELARQKFIAGFRAEVTPGERPTFTPPEELTIKKWSVEFKGKKIGEDCKKSDYT